MKKLPFRRQLSCFCYTWMMWCLFQILLKIPNSLRMYRKTFACVVSWVSIAPKRKLCTWRLKMAIIHCVQYWAPWNGRNIKILWARGSTNHRNECVTCLLEVGKRFYMHLRTYTIGDKLNVGFSRNVSLMLWW